MSLIAVTGGIGAGKTAVLKFFQKFGASVLDADDVAHSVYLPGTSVYGSLLSRWGEGILNADGQLNRSAIAGRVFGHPEELSWLNSVTHPAIRRSILEKAESCATNLYCAVPLLYESGWQGDAEYVIVLWCDRETQKRRLLLRGWSEEQIALRLHHQLSMDDKLRLGDFGIVSNCSWEVLEQQCSIVYDRLLK